jgi:hypothetical protein
MACERALIAFDAERERRRAAQQRVLEKHLVGCHRDRDGRDLERHRRSRTASPATNLAPLFGMHKNVRRRLAG